MSNAAPAPAADPFAERLASYRRDGFVLLPGVHPPERIAAWRAAFPALRARHNFPHGGHDEDLVDLMELAPELFLDAVAEPTLLDLAERVMGPRVQLDSIHFRHDRAQPAHLRLRPVAWHRDMDALWPSGAYQAPLAINVITYLQDLDDEIGPFRCLPGSHLKPRTIEPARRCEPQPDELLVRPRAGDVLVTHNGLWHSGTHNTSGRERFFLSLYYHVNWFPTRDNFAGAAVARIRAWARARGDVRLLRLFGIDQRRIERMHGMGMDADEATWARWRAQDAADAAAMRRA